MQGPRVGRARLGAARGARWRGGACAWGRDVRLLALRSRRLQSIPGAPRPAAPSLLLLLTAPLAFAPPPPPPRPRRPQETNTNSPSTLSPQQQAELIECATKSLAALGLNHGVQHTELKYTSRGARLLEVRRAGRRRAGC